MINFKTIACATVIAATGSMAAAADWTLDAANSTLAFGSVKNDYIGESHSFTGLSGSASGDTATVEISLASVQTNIDIRNERMIEHVFQSAATASISAEFDMAAMEAMAVGDMATMESFGTLTLLGEEIPLDVNLHVVRLSEDRVMVTSDGLIMLSTDDAGIDGAIDTLQELAGLDGITRVTPVTMRFVFDAAS